ncbi:GspH/FimT family pseudopilin [Methylobacterium oxalidis]|uniref:Type II secretion system protein H n=1 Tax=Methylobacterium oxalidis TaxID=944322 RepID=A0A512JCD5_9HYPH|nr:GspH/FimT family pseudopilin [Methylobacterium oxalidis]GEP07581.1 hypothetical protein MOX02_56190 [Methylobacterium oxalidis]GJE34689.1 hypothetical protein LDDCCGHA_4902 [Methylobacterium oxalidis]GLS64449.1 hypothetical protein GCM10007888_28300 [Methylobacterium oxalidis]
MTVSRTAPGVPDFRDPCRSRAGFSLIEILVTVAILSGVALLAAPLLRRPPAELQLRADLGRLAAALRITRAAAMMRNEPLGLLLDTESRRFVSPAVPRTTLDPRTEVTLALPDPDERTGSRGRIRFFPSGRSTGGQIRLRLGRSEGRLDVVWATGQIVASEVVSQVGRHDSGR